MSTAAGPPPPPPARRAPAAPPPVGCGPKSLAPRGAPPRRPGARAAPLGPVQVERDQSAAQRGRLNGEGLLVGGQQRIRLRAEQSHQRADEGRRPRGAVLVQGVVTQRFAQQDPRPPRILLEVPRAAVDHLAHVGAQVTTRHHVLDPRQ